MTFTILRQPRVLGTDKSFVTLKYNSECICKYLPEQDEIYTHVLEHRQSFRSGFSTANQINFDLQLSDLQSVR